MESQGGEFDALVPGLQFPAQKETATYLRSRTFSSWWPQGAQSYSPAGLGGTQMIRFVLADPSGNSFIDLSTLRLHMQLNNLDGAKDLDFPQHSISSWFRRIRILVCGTVVEDIHFSGRLAQQLELMRPPARNWSDSIMGLGASESDFVTVTGGGNALRSTGFGNGFRNRPIGPNDSRNICGVIGPSGLLSSHYWLSGLHPLVIELELADAMSCCSTGTVTAGPPETYANSMNYNFTNVCIKGDVISVENEIGESYRQLLMNGKGVVMHLSSYAHTQHTIPNIAPNTRSNFDVVVQRAFSRIKTIFMSFSNAHYAKGGDFTEFSSFISPHGGADHNDPLGRPIDYEFERDQMTYHIAVGPILYPQLPCRGHAEAYVQLSKCLAMDSSVDGLSFQPTEFFRACFLPAVCCEKATGTPGSGLMAYTGLSTRQTGDSVRFSFANFNCAPNHTIERFYCVLHYDLILNIRLEGATVEE